MSRHNIFLSYRRDDAPGYVSRLEDELERKFGDGRVFRDATDIPGGSRWKTVIDDNLRKSAVLLLIIGPRWEKIWNQRKDDDVNYVVLELESARDLGVPIFPVTLDGTKLSKEIERGDLRWIFDDYQAFDISDRQGRWAGDFDRLVRRLEVMEGIGPAKRADPVPPPPKPGIMSRMKWIGAGVALSFGGLIWLGAYFDEPTTAEDDWEGPVSAYIEPNNTVVVPTPGPTIPPPEPTPVSVPNIGGVWQSVEDGTIYFLEQYADGTLAIESPDYASGHGWFAPDMPRKVFFELYGVGTGELTVSADNRKAMGYIVVDGQQEFDTLIRIE